MLVVQAVHAAEVGDTTLSGHPRAAEKDDMPALADPVLKLFELLIHKSASLMRADVGIGSYVLRWRQRVWGQEGHPPQPHPRLPFRLWWKR